MADIAELGFSVNSKELAEANRQLDKLPPSAEKAQRATDQFNRTADHSKKSLDGMASGANVAGTAIARLASGMAAIFGVNQLIQYTNVWTDLNSRVERATGSMGAGAQTMERLSDMARRTYSSLELTAEGFLRNATSMRQLGYTTGETLDFIEAINNALVVSGAKGERAESVMNALGKAMALGNLSGDNLEVVMMQGGRVAEALADSLGVTVVELRKMGAEGKLTSDVIGKGLVSQLEKLREEADAMPATIGDAFVLLGNSILETIGKLDQASGVSRTVADAIIAIADNADMLVPILGGLATMITATMIPAVVAFTASLLVNPLFLFAAAIGAIAAAAIYFTGQFGEADRITEEYSESIGANQKAMDTAMLATKGYSQALRDSIAMQVASTKASLAEADAVTVVARAKAAASRFELFGMNFGNAFDEKAADLALKKSLALDGALSTLELQLAEVDAHLLKSTAPALPPMPPDMPLANAKITDGARDFIAAQRLEAQALGMTTLQANSLRYAQDLLNQATAGGKTVSAEQRQELVALASEMARTEESTKQLTDAYNFGKETLSQFFSDFKSDLMNGSSLWTAFANAGLNALDSIANKLMETASNGIWDMLFNAFASGVSGGFGGGGAQLKLGYQFADGGYTGNMGTGQAAGVVHGQEYVLNAQATRSIGVANLDAMNDNGRIPANNNAGGMGPVIVTYAPVFNGLGMSREDVEDMVRSAQQDFMDGLPDAVQAIQADPRRRVAK